MRTFILAAMLLFAMSCATVLPSAGALMVAEGMHHLTSMSVISVPAPRSAETWDGVIKPGVEALRNSPGNLSVFVFRSTAGGDVEYTVLSEWDSEGDAAGSERNPDCARLLHASTTRSLDVLFEAAQWLPQ